MNRERCESIRPLISAYMDGELTADEGRELHAHLVFCEECRQLVQEYQGLRETLRELPPVKPPADLAHDIWKQTIERSPSRFERWFGISGARFGMATAAVVAILVIATAFFLVRGYQRGTTPAVASTSLVPGQVWPIQKPIAINFNKPMNHASVEENLRILPRSEGDLTKTWQGNTLIIGPGPTGGRTLAPNTDYTIMIFGAAKDAYGNSLGSAWSMKFHTSETRVVQSDTPTPTATSAPSPTPTSQVAVGPASTPAPSPSESSPTTGPTSTPTSMPTTAPSQPPASPTATLPSVSPTQPAETGTATEPPTTAPTASPSPTPSPAASPSPTATSTPTTGTPQPTASSTATSSTSTPAASPTQVPVTGAFGSVYWSNAPVRDRLGPAKPPPNPGLSPDYTFNASVLGFQHGTMYERFDQTLIYILYSDGRWEAVDDTWTADMPPGGGPAPDQPNLYEPSQGFGKVWNEREDVRTALGYAVSPSATTMAGRAQEFANGLMLYSDDGFVYVLYNDGQWEMYPDTSGHGDLLTPTPADGAGSPAPSPEASPADAPDATASPATTP